MVSKLLKMQQLEDDDELAYTSTDSDSSPTAQSPGGQEDGRPSWMKTLHASAATWLELLPKQLPVRRHL